jgi:hypothetical protein
MTNSLDVKTEISNSTLILVVAYPSDVLTNTQSSQALLERLVKAYDGRNRSEVGPSCIVEIKAEVAGSSVVRALFDLWKSVSANSGELRIVGYPSDYTDSLTSLGVTTLKGFQLSASRDEALRSLQVQPNG